MTTRFEGGSLSKIVNDPSVVEASEKFVRIVIRRPHAYRFRARYSIDGKMPIPGFVVLNSKGDPVSQFSLSSSLEVATQLNKTAE